jgi:hypothetical protein
VGAAPDRVLVLAGDRAIKAAGIEGVDDPVPIQLTAAGDAVAPPAGVPGPEAGDRLTEDAIPRPASRVDFDVLGLDREHPARLQTRPESIDRIDA